MHSLLLVLALAFDARGAAADPQSLAALRQVAKEGLFKFHQREAAAFLVRDDSGALSAVMWPHTGRYRSERYEGPVPAGTVAIAHTHPPNAGSEPSRHDVEQARRIGMPIYVLTRWNVYVVDGDGTVHHLIEQRKWTD